MLRVKFDQVVAEDIFGAIGELIKTLQGGLKFAGGECKRLAILGSYRGETMNSAVITADFEVD
jgi:hypothetical protein